MPVVSWSTLYLPHSQKYEAGYLAFLAPGVPAATSTDHYVQLPLAKGDAVFFNPALFHGAGTNHSADIRRMANLLQVSSAFGRAMETVDRERVSNTESMPRCWWPSARGTLGGAGGEWRTSSQRAPRATPSRRTSTATSRSAVWRHPPRPTSSPRPCARWVSTARSCGARLAAQAQAKLSR